MNVSTKRALAMQVLATCILLAGCANSPAPQPVATACVAPDFPHRPAVTDTDENLSRAPDFATRFQLLAGNHFPRDAWEAKAEEQLNLCR